jgi:hypothetical protein
MMAECGDEFVLEQFNRLVKDLLAGTLHRNSFRRWEVDLMVDLDDCGMREAKKKQLLRRYHRALNKHFERGAETHFSLSEYLATHGRQDRTRNVDLEVPMLS